MKLTIVLGAIICGLLQGQVPINPQTITINAANQSQFCVGGTSDTGSQAAGTTGIINLTPPYNTLVYGKDIHCVVPTSMLQNNPFVIVVVRFVEPNRVSFGQRVFRVTVNGTISDIDLVKLGGLLKPYEVPFYSYVRDNLNVNINSSNGTNAVFSQIDIILPSSSVVTANITKPIDDSVVHFWKDLFNANFAHYAVAFTAQQPLPILLYCNPVPNSNPNVCPWGSTDMLATVVNQLTNPNPALMPKQ